MKKSYVYLIINKLRHKTGGMPKYYIGYKMVCRDKGNYYGSSKLLNEDIGNIGVKNFLKIILKTFDIDCEARQYEQKLLTHFNARYNELFYNQTNGDVDFVSRPQHGKVCLRGNNRTDRQKLGDKTKYITRSQKRIVADKKHSELMKQKTAKGEINYLFEGRDKWRHTVLGHARWEEIKRQYSQQRKGITKNEDAGRMKTSVKLKNNENAKKGAIKLANMSDAEFADYLLSITQHSNIQKQMKTRRQKGITFLQTGIWEKYGKSLNT